MRASRALHSLALYCGIVARERHQTLLGGAARCRNVMRGESVQVRGDSGRRLLSFDLFAWSPIALVRLATGFMYKNVV